MWQLLVEKDWPCFTKEHFEAEITLEKNHRSVSLAWYGCRGEELCPVVPPYQLTAPHHPPPIPMVLLSIIDIPFMWVEMNLVGPLPKSAQCHKYILVIMVYANQYPEAVPLWKATSTAIATKLVLLFSHVGITKKILTDQGTPFMFKKGQQREGMKKVTTEGGHDWDWSLVPLPLHNLSP